MNFSQITPDEKMFLRRLIDISEIAKESQRPRFTGFLNQRQIMIAQNVMKQFECETRFFGGFSGAVRQIFALYNSSEYLSDSSFPIEVIHAKHYSSDKLNHRDILGSVIGLGIAREAIGDILIENGSFNILVATTVKEVFLEEFKKVGRTDISCKLGSFDSLTNFQEYKIIKGTVSSIRLDCLVGLLTGISREKSAMLISNELVQCNYIVQKRTSTNFAEADTITIRGYGKYIVDYIGNPTRKNRLPIECRKYT